MGYDVDRQDMTYLKARTRSIVIHGVMHVAATLTKLNLNLEPAALNKYSIATQAAKD